MNDDLLKEIADNYSDYLKYAKLRFKDSEVNEQVVNDVYLTIANAKRKMVNNNPKEYIRAIIRNLGLHKIKRESTIKKYIENDSRMIMTTNCTPEILMQIKEFVSEYPKYLSLLTPAERKATLLHLNGGDSFLSVLARENDMNENTFKLQKFRGVQRLKSSDLHKLFPEEIVETCGTEYESESTYVVFNRK